MCAVVVQEGGGGRKVYEESGEQWKVGGGLNVFWCGVAVFFFFKQKTAYEIVSRDWSSDVCSSDLWISDLQCKIIDECLQLHGGWGYMDEYPIGQMYQEDRKSVV